MSACRTLAIASSLPIDGRIRRIATISHLNLGFNVPSLSSPLRPPFRSSKLPFNHTRCHSSDAAINLPEDTVEELLTRGEGIQRLMKMERRTKLLDGRGRWFPYLDVFKASPANLDSREVIHALAPYIMEGRKDRIEKAVRGRSYAVCLVVEGLTDFGNVSAAFRSADALGIQSVHVISSDKRKRYKDNRHVSMGAEKWLDIEVWESPMECFEVLRARGYRIATTHLAADAVSIYELDWSCPTAIVVGNEHLGISEDALQLSDLHCSIPMKGMVDSFNVSVAAGILMHHAVCDRVSRQQLLSTHGERYVGISRLLGAKESGHEAAAYILGMLYFQEVDTRVVGVELLNMLATGCSSCNCIRGTEPGCLILHCRRKTASLSWCKTFWKLPNDMSLSSCANAACGRVIGSAWMPDDELRRTFCSPLCRWGFEYCSLMKRM